MLTILVHPKDVKTKSKQGHARFKGLKLSDEDHEQFRERERQGKMGMLLTRRIQILRLLDQGWTQNQTAEAASTHPREVRRIIRRYVEGGVERALTTSRDGRAAKRWTARRPRR